MAIMSYRGLLSSIVETEGHGHWTQGQAERTPVSTDLWLHHRGLAVCTFPHLFCVCVMECTSVHVAGTCTQIPHGCPRGDSQLTS